MKLQLKWKWASILLSAIFVVASLAYINLKIVPQQITHANVDLYQNHDSCWDVIVSASDYTTPNYSACGNPPAQYGSTATFTITNTSAYYSHTVNWVWLSYFCPEGGNPDVDATGKHVCLGDGYAHQLIKHGSTFVDNGSSNNATASVCNSPASFGFPQYSNCGTYQNDFFITSVDGNNCTLGSYNGDSSHSWTTDLDGYYYSNTACVASTPTPTPVPPTPTPTTPVTPTPTKPVTPTPTTPVTPTPTTPVTPTPTTPVTPTGTVTPTPPPATSSCYFSPNSLTLESGVNGTTNLYYSTQNLSQSSTHATVCLSVDNGAPTYVADTATDLTNFPVSENVTASHTYTATIFLKSAGDNNFKTCEGTAVYACSAQTNLPGVTPTPLPPSGCTSNCGNTYITQQQQQQQQVLGAVAPAPQATTLPGTGADTEVVFGLISLLGVGLRLRSKFI